MKLPADMRDFYSLVDGLEEEDSEHLRILPIEDVKSVAEALDESTGLDVPAKVFVFGEFLLRSHFYALDLSSADGRGQHIYIVGSNQPLLVAQSFREFLESYLDGSARLFRGVESA